MHMCAHLHDATMPQVAMVLGKHVGYAERQSIDAQLQVADPQRAAHFALDVLLKVHTSISRGKARQGAGTETKRPISLTHYTCCCCCACNHACFTYSEEKKRLHLM